MRLEGKVRLVLQTALCTAPFAGGGGHGRAISHHTTIQLDAVGMAVLHSTQPWQYSCYRLYTTSVHRLNCTYVEQWIAKLIHPDFSHPLLISSL